MYPVPGIRIALQNLATELAALSVLPSQIDQSCHSGKAKAFDTMKKKKRQARRDGGGGDGAVVDACVRVGVRGGIGGLVGGQVWRMIPVVR